MDLDDFRSILRNSGVDIWTLIDTAISIASEDYRNEIRDRRDAIVERLYSSSPVILTRCETCNNQEPVKVVSGGTDIKEKESSSHEGKGGSPPTPQWINNNNNNNEEEEEEEDEGRIYGQRRRSMDDEQIKILDIKEQLEDPHQSEDALVNLLQDLEDMDITFKALKETDIGRHVNLLRKHPSSEVRRMVKQVVRKWKYLVDAWVKGSSPGQNAPSTFSGKKWKMSNIFFVFLLCLRIVESSIGITFEILTKEGYQWVQLMGTLHSRIHLEIFKMVITRFWLLTVTKHS
ncbi:hypothetical protein AQUCO_01400394v1 [Aquilegia coerulea]|uniref:TFIIS N-terminal domain-containing protein n=1 Tax=Aquilegia coerulea TaxID=218851 RepID=A0A2G5DW69_AQUCA|nr:hypothetical protein AQUCO_01400394v1 [Aquilegia coerulea]